MRVGPTIEMGFSPEARSKGVNGSFALEPSAQAGHLARFFVAYSIHTNKRGCLQTTIYEDKLYVSAIP